MYVETVRQVTRLGACFTQHPAFSVLQQCNATFMHSLLPPSNNSWPVKDMCPILRRPLDRRACRNVLAGFTRRRQSGLTRVGCQPSVVASDEKRKWPSGSASGIASAASRYQAQRAEKHPALLRREMMPAAASTCGLLKFSSIWTPQSKTPTEA